ncbi:MAG: Abi family protein [Bacteroidales bacterium]|nr:Abi family protein [Bacteroidales bacterium]
MAYTKTAKSIPELISMLQSRGLIISDIDQATDYLKKVSYFRLAAYLRPLEADKETHSYKPGAKFETAQSLYKFDADLRMLVFSSIQSLEIALRSFIIQNFTMQYGPGWFSDEHLVINKFRHTENLSNLVQELDRTKEDFIHDHYAKYGRNNFPPAWKSLELASFGILTKFYFNFADTKTKKQVARMFNLPQHEVLESWLRAINDLRNCCAHHNRIWNRNYSAMPQLPRKLSGNWISNFDTPTYRLYAVICCILHCLNAIEPSNTFVQDFKALLTAHPEVDTAAMGCPDNWQTEPLWK